MCVGTYESLYIYGHHRASARSSHRKVLTWQYKNTINAKTKQKPEKRSVKSGIIYWPSKKFYSPRELTILGEITDVLNVSIGTVFGITCPAPSRLRERTFGEFGWSRKASLWQKCILNCVRLSLEKLVKVNGFQSFPMWGLVRVSFTVSSYTQSWSGICPKTQKKKKGQRSKVASK